MRVCLMANNWAGWQATEWLSMQASVEIVGLVVHPPGKGRFVDEIVAASGLEDAHIFRADRLGDQKTQAGIARLQPDLGISVYFGFILDGELLRVFPKGALNLHPSLLPFNRGAHTNVWPIVDGTPAGVTIHYMDEGVDTGDILFQRRVLVESTDTGQSLYRRLEVECVDLLRESWPFIASGDLARVSQRAEEGTTHSVADLRETDEIQLDQVYTARELIDMLRARTFCPHPGAHFIDQSGRRVYMRLELYQEGEEDK